MALIFDLAAQSTQMILVLALAPLLLGFTRKVKARLLRRRGPSIFQPYRDLLRLMRKEVVLADNASWLFRPAPYLIFAATWVAAALVPTFATGLMFSWSADLIVITALWEAPGSFLRSPAWTSDELRRHWFEPRDDVRFSRRTGDDHDRFCCGAHRRLDTAFRNRVPYALAHRTARVLRLGADRSRHRRHCGKRQVPVDNPATHLELTMVHEAMVLEYSGRHLAVIELAAALKLLLYVSLIACIFAPWGLAPHGADLRAITFGAAAYVAKLVVGGFLSGVF